MPQMTILHDFSIGHDPKPAVGSTSFNIKINGFPPMLLGDFWSVHKVGKWVHSYNVAQASSFVTNQGTPICYAGCACTCGVRAGFNPCTRVYIAN